jgi:hypothetical protein
MINLYSFNDPNLPSQLNRLPFVYVHGKAWEDLVKKFGKDTDSDIILSDTFLPLTPGTDITINCYLYDVPCLMRIVTINNIPHGRVVYQSDVDNHYYLKNDDIWQ